MSEEKSRRAIGADYSMSYGELLERREFGSFAVLRTGRGIFYENYTGYHIWTTAYATWIDGTPREKNLYAWLKHLMEFAARADADPDGEYEDTGMTNKDFLNYMSLMAESILSYPMVAFSDLDRAVEFAGKHIRWLRERAEELQSQATTGRLSTDDADERIMAEDRARLSAMETLSAMSPKDLLDAGDE